VALRYNRSGSSIESSLLQTVHIPRLEALRFFNPSAVRIQQAGSLGADVAGVRRGSHAGDHAVHRDGNVNVVNQQLIAGCRYIRHAVMDVQLPLISTPVTLVVAREDAVFD